MSLNTRFFPTQIPFARSRTLTFLWPSPRNSLSSSTSRIASTKTSSLSSVFGPRFIGALDSCFASWPWAR